MKKSLVFFCATLLATSAATLAADFEGTVKMKMTGPRGTPNEMTFSLTKGKSRIDMQTRETGGAAILLDQAKQEMTILMPEQRMYMVRPMPKPEDMPASAPRQEATLEKTNDTEKILGYDCAKYLSKSPEGLTELWLTDQLGTFMGIGGNPMAGPGGRGRGGHMPEGWANALRGKDVFPLRVITRDGSGKESFRMEATAVNKTVLPASTFTPPADYQKFDMDGMMRGMGMPGMRPPGGG